MEEAEKRAPSQLTAANVTVMVAFVFLETALVLVIALTKTVTADGRRLYNTATIVLVSELLKAVVSFVGLHAATQASAAAVVFRQRGDSDNEAVPVLTGEEQGLGELRRLSLLGSLRYAVPGLLYTVNNNMYLVILTLMSPAYFQLLLNSRVVWTGFAFRWFMGRHLSQRQWIASVTLLFGCVLSQFGTQASASTEGGVSVTLTGLLLTLLYCFISVTASIFIESLMKSEPSLHVANIQLAGCSVLFNVLVLAWQGGGPARSYWAGWDLPSTWIICALQAVIGLLVSRVVKRLDSIMKIFCVSCSNLLVYAASVAAGDEPLTATFFAAFAIVTWSGYCYTTVAAPGFRSVALPASPNTRVSRVRAMSEA